MKVCNICLGSPTHAGSPVVQDRAGEKQYVFSKPGADYTSIQVDFCEDCMDLLQSQQWDKIAEKAHDVLMLRLGVVPDH